MPFYPGSFLVAKYSLQDPNFRQTVILMIQHSAEGAFGLVVNRPIVLKEFPYPVFVGGPCEAQGMFMLHGYEEWAGPNSEGETSSEIAPGIFIGTAESAFLAKELTTDELQKVRMFAGYSGWGPGQLESELVEGAWSIVAADGKTLFGTQPKELWTHLRPPSLPQFSMN